MDLSSTTVVVVLMVEISHGQGFAKSCKRERRRRWCGTPRARGGAAAWCRRWGAARVFGAARAWTLCVAPLLLL